MKIFGKRESISFEFGIFDNKNPQYINLDVWILGRKLTYFDNYTYIGTFNHYLKRDIDSLVNFESRMDKKIISYKEARKYYFKWLNGNYWIPNAIRFNIFNVGETFDDCFTNCFVNKSSEDCYLVVRLLNSSKVSTLSINRLEFIELLRIVCLELEQLESVATSHNKGN